MRQMVCKVTLVSVPSSSLACSHNSVNFLSHYNCTSLSADPLPQAEFIHRLEFFGANETLVFNNKITGSGKRDCKRRFKI